jgi:hypothetical protein
VRQIAAAPLLAFGWLSGETSPPQNAKDPRFDSDTEFAMPWCIGANTPMNRPNLSTRCLAAAGAATLLSSTSAYGCACGCGVFDVGTESMLPSGPGTMVSLEYDYQDQNRNWSGSSRASADDNGDKEIATHFVTLGVQHMFNRSWGFNVELPYVNRTFVSDTGAPSYTHFHWGDLGDIRIRGIYAGFAEDLSTGLTFGLKLPTGNYTYNDPAGDIDRDSEIGTGSTDVLLGFWHRRSFLDGQITGIFQANADLPTFTRDQYRPGFEFDASLGAYYNGWSLGRAKIRPLFEVIGSVRTHDCGANANFGDTGYQRLILAPGVEVDIHPVHIFADVGFPVYQSVSGNQLVSPTLFKVVASYMF